MVGGFQLSLPLIFTTLMGIVEKYFRVSGQRLRSCVEMCEFHTGGGIHCSGVISMLTCFM